MKKILGILVLGLLWCNTLFAESIELDQGIKVNIPKGYEYLQFDQLEFMRANMEAMEVSKSKIDEIVDEMKLLLGMNGSETSTIIGKKGYAKGYGDFINHTLSGNPPESWEGFNEFEKKCGNKKTEKSMMKCLIRFFKMDPIIQIDVGNGSNKDLKELTSALNEINVSDKNDIDDFNKSSEKIKNTFSEMYQNEINLKFVKVKNKQWGFEILGEDTMMGFTAKRIGYMFIPNEHAFIIQGFCMSQTTCKNIKKLNNKIIEPYLSMNLKNKKTVINNSEEGNLTEQLQGLNDLYKSGVLTKEEFTKAKNKLLN